MNIKEFAAKYGAEIIFGTSIAGVLGSSVAAVIVTPKAVADANQHTDKWERIKAAGKHYILPAGGMVLSIAGLISVLVTKNKRISTLALACAASEQLYSDYRNKVVEVIGENKEAKVQDKLVEDKVNKTEIPESPKETFILDATQKCLCFDFYTGRYFMSNKQLIDNGLNQANADLVSQGYLSLNDFYFNIGLDSVTVGADNGWNFNEDGLITITPTSILKDGATPVFAIRFDKRPHEGFDRFA